MTRPSNELIKSLDHEWHHALCALIAKTYPAYQTTALDMFARDGALAIQHTPWLTWDAWELEPQFEAALKSHGVQSPVIGDTYVTVKSWAKTYDQIWPDAPQGRFHDSQGNLHSEHFDLLPDMVRLLNRRGLIVPYVNKQPYDKNVEGDYGVDSYPEYSFADWMEVRKAFFGKAWVTDGEAICAYERAIERAGAKVLSALVVPAITGYPGMPPSFRLVLEVSKD